MSPMGQCVCVTFVEAWALGRLASLSAHTQYHPSEVPFTPYFPGDGFYGYAVQTEDREGLCINAALCVAFKACHGSATKEADKDGSAGNFLHNRNQPSRRR